MLQILYSIVLAALVLAVPSSASVTYNTVEEMEASVHIQAGVNYARDGELDKAIESFKKAIEIFPGADEAYYDMGLVYMDMGEYEKAVESFEKVYDKAPDDIGLNFNYGFSLVELERYKEALPMLEKVLEENPEDMRLKELIEETRRKAK